MIRLNGVPPMPYYTLDTSKLQHLGLKFKSLDVMFDDCVAFLQKRGLLTRKTTTTTTDSVSFAQPPRIGVLHSNVEPLAVRH